MGRREKPKTVVELNRHLCGAICLCQLTVVLSSVSLIYLSVAVYMPSHRAFHSGFDPQPVMCQTVHTSNVNNCNWASCGEWCLTKTTGFCPQMHVTVRQNATDLLLNNCTSLNNVSCPPVGAQLLRPRLLSPVPLVNPEFWFRLIRPITEKKDQLPQLRL